MLRAALLAVLLLPAAAPAATNLIINGDFETAGGTATVPAGWTLNTAGDDRSALRLDGNFYAPYGVTGTAAQRDNHFLALGAYDTIVSAGFYEYFVYAEQNFATIAGQSYQFSYDVAQFGPYLQYAGVGIYDDAGLKIGYDGGYLTDGYDLGSMFTHYHGSFVASGSTTTLRLMDYGRTDSTDVFFDNIVVTGTAIAAVPEPAAWMMMVGGFGLVGSGLRRRRAQLAQAR